MNVELLQKVKQHILEEPKRLHMSTWLDHGEPGIHRVFKSYKNSWGESAPEFPACGTVGCIAGWVCQLSAAPVREIGPMRACLALSIPYGRGMALFHVSTWDEPYRSRYITAESQEERAELVGMVIDQFIAKYADVTHKSEVPKANVEVWP